jgi:hypothetical protein
MLACLSCEYYGRIGPVFASFTYPIVIPASAQGCPGKRNLARGDAEKKHGLDRHQMLVFGITVDEIFGAPCAQKLCS